MYTFTENFNDDFLMVAQSQDVNCLRAFLKRLRVKNKNRQICYQGYPLTYQEEKILEDAFGPTFNELIEEETNNESKNSNM